LLTFVYKLSLNFFEKILYPIKERALEKKNSWIVREKSGKNLWRYFLWNLEKSFKKKKIHFDFSQADLEICLNFSSCQIPDFLKPISVENQKNFSGEKFFMLNCRTDHYWYVLKEKILLNKNFKKLEKNNDFKHVLFEKNIFI